MTPPRTYACGHARTPSWAVDSPWLFAFGLFGLRPFAFQRQILSGLLAGAEP
jgi:hypothetical protein